MKNEKVWKIAMTGVFAALSYVVFTFLQFKIWLPGGDATSIHFGNAVCVLGALILGGVYGGIGGIRTKDLHLKILHRPHRRTDRTQNR